MPGYMYILRCADGTLYTGSTKTLQPRLNQHQRGEGSKYTADRLPVMLIYYEEYQRIDDAYQRELQIKGWSRKKKLALIAGAEELLPDLAKAYRDLPRDGFESLSQPERDGR